MVSLASALDGVASLRGPGAARRDMPVAEFVTGDGRNALRPGELLTHVWLPAASLASRTAFRQLSLSPVGRSAVLVIARRDFLGRTVVTVTASTPRPVRLRFPSPPTPGEVLAGLDGAAPAYLDDIHGNAPWRAAMTRRLIAEVLGDLAR
jgi:CO/xanthine dehydrogenase FAD-binding subunit